MEKSKLIRIFNKQAKQYDRRREGPNQRRWRERLIGSARGEVLELGVGAGANFPFYPPGVSVTAADFSPAMLEKAERAAKLYRVSAKLICSDTEELSFPDHTFDTIVSTLTLCSYKQPLAVLENIRRWCKPDGVILLMEHGKSSYSAVSAAQNVLDPVLYRLVGCHHTRDIMALVTESGIKADRVEHHWLNMVHLIWGRPEK